jgi:hypothetical protein
MNQSGTIQGMLLSDSLKSLLGSSLSLGNEIMASGKGKYFVNGLEFMLDDAIAENIIVLV